MEPFSLEWAAERMGGTLQGTATGTVTGVCVDSRQAGPGMLFFALQGENTDGHKYVAQALAAGAVAAVVEYLVDLPQIETNSENDKNENDKKVGDKKLGAQIIVPASLRALGDLARSYRQRFAIPIVGITGSVGKTSTKEMVATILRTTYNTLASEKNYNNEIGVPLTLFRLDSSHEAAVIEMGMRGLGEIDYLAQIALPTIALITNIGHAHIERLGSQENIARAKAEIFAHLPEDGIAILPHKDKHRQLLEDRIPVGVRKLTFATNISVPRADVWLRSITIQIREDGAPAFRLWIGDRTHSLPVQLQAVGVHHVDNAIAALTVAVAMEIPIEKAIPALENWQGAEGRMVVHPLPTNITLLDDCYNASPESMKAALNTLARLSKNGVAVLGDMRELGDHALAIHEQIGMQLARADLRLLVTIGDLAKHLATHFISNRSPHKPPCDTVHFTNALEAAARIRELVQPGDTVLIKGSRAMEMEVIVQALIKVEADSNTNLNEQTTEEKGGHA